MSRRGPLRTTKQYRAGRLRKAIHYLKLAGNLSDARKLANKCEGFQANTSVWMTAIGRILMEKHKP